MARTLDVYMHRELVGHLIQDNGGQMVFDYAESWLQRPDATLLSHSLPLRRGRFTRKECRGYLAGFCPMRANARLLPAIWASANGTITRCWSGSAGSARALSRLLPLAKPFPPSMTITARFPRRNWPGFFGNFRAVRCWLARPVFVSRWLVPKTKLPCAWKAMLFRSLWAARPAHTF